MLLSDELHARRCVELVFPPRPPALLLVQQISISKVSVWVPIRSLEFQGPMMATPSADVTTLVKQVIAWMVAGAFGAVEQRANGVRLSAAELAAAVNNYGRTLAMPPDAAFADLDAIAVSGKSRPTWSIRVDFWTKEEGRSDLTLECTVIENGNDTLALEIEDLHVADSGATGRAFRFNLFTSTVVVFPTVVAFV